MGLTYTYVIVLDNSNLIKIGKSKTLNDRVRQIKTANPFVKTIHTIAGDYESYLHRCLSGLRYKGEWFKLEENKVKDVIESLIHIRLNSFSDCEAVNKFLNR